ncbi:MAG: hypothetical protein LBL73_08790, partial [Synergistaceae bacterium]|nr:hypothetical protein [Synergistaceae bacterium]
VLAESLDDGENKTAVIFQDLDLSGEKGFYARARHKGALAGKSPWSPTRRALLKEFHDDFLIGVGITEGGAVFRIDGEGKPVAVEVPQRLVQPPQGPGRRVRRPVPGVSA